MLVENILFLQNNYPVLYNEMKRIEDDINQEFVSVEDTRSNNKTLKIEKDGSELYLHSKYDPIREAEVIINKFSEQENISDDSHVIFYGVGLGYHIDIFSKLYPNTSFSIYEPSVEVFSKFLSNKRIESFSRKMETVYCEYKLEIMDEFFNQIINKTDKKNIIVDLPIYKNAFSEQYGKFYERFKEAIRNKRSSFHTDYAFQERWIMNSMINFKEVLNTPNILMQDQELFKGKTAILVAAGPSLDYEIENLKKIKDEGLAFIFSVGSAINTLVHNDILPDAICTYDPGEQNQKVFKKINNKDITHIPMIFGSSVGFEVLQQYKGSKLHMITSQDTISRYFLKTEDDTQLVTVRDAPSIAVVTLEMLNKLGFSTVILVGQNLSFMKNKAYAEGVDYIVEATEELKNLIMIKNVIGKEVGTNSSYNNMRSQLEKYIKDFTDMTIINTTVDGAHIEGAKFTPMETVLTDILRNKIVMGNEFDEQIKSNNYDEQYIKSKILTFQAEYLDYKNVLIEIRYHLEKMNKLCNNRNIKQLDIMYTKLDAIFNNIVTNDFFRIIAKPMNRVQYDILSNNVKQIKDDRDGFKKAAKIISLFQLFLQQLSITSIGMDDMYNHLIEIMSSWRGSDNK